MRKAFNFSRYDPKKGFNLSWVCIWGEEDGSRDFCIRKVYTGRVFGQKLSVFLISWLDHQLVDDPDSSDCFNWYFSTLCLSADRNRCLSDVICYGLGEYEVLGTSSYSAGSIRNSCIN